ncbi:NAD-dependent epimerase/dehydratase family protein [Micromonospora sp. DR5-3]|uniref:NAD-dependent epimerase/dehydratase family protein n=1 Tax=unclassified Micromonospora TaxID=2617518 RepID=UPI0011DB6D42|nr:MULTISPECIES: NAD-dependent epimerase/dehydratase family protein [unclassified Micromonospora]MCW3815958.1 NAD-dependent epimerase/dehydratase family protein [Micromonospora sp. DR5-3]TYC24451.1 NAD-dependent epimerase/dehydratase family protein [Micromonospora sp. MP36]
MNDEPATVSSNVPALRVFVAGATGVIGSRLLPLLTRAGHTVAGMTRTASKAGLVQELGAEPVVCDVYDAAALTTAVKGFRPDLVLHELTDLPDTTEELPARRADNARIRIEGTRNLIAAATAADCGRLLAQSVAWELPPGNGAEAVRALEEAILGFGGVVLRYGQFYGPETFYPDAPPAGPRIHIDAAAERTVAVLDRPSGIHTITDDTSTSD